MHSALLRKNVDWQVNQSSYSESKILTAKADVESAKLMRQTADILSSKAAMQIRYLETMKSIANSAGVKIVLIGEEENS